MKITIEIPECTEQQAKELVEEIHGGLMWSRDEDGALRAYPTTNDEPAVIWPNVQSEPRHE